MTSPPPEAVITVKATIMSGTVVRWYRTVGDAEHQQPVLSASREGVAVHASYLTQIPELWVLDAKRAFEQLHQDRNADMSSWATHQPRKVSGFRSGPLDPVERALDPVEKEA